MSTSITALIYSLLFVSSMISLTAMKKIPNQKSDQGASMTCTIKNLKYSNEYLYDTNDPIYLTSTIETNRRAHVNPLNVKYISTLEQILWILEYRSNNTYLIKSLLFENYLCASNKHIDMLGFRRIVNLSGSKEAKQNQGCIWQLKEFVKDYEAKKNFRILNMMYNQYFYAASDIFKTANLRRSVFLWYKKPDSQQFDWSFDCM